MVVTGTICVTRSLPVPFREDDLWLGIPRKRMRLRVGEESVACPTPGISRLGTPNGIYLLPVNLYGPGDNFDPAFRMSFLP
jgi:GDP-L-fucose synthase